MFQDIRLALRSLRQQPGFSALAIIIVALGAGANAAVFSVVRAVLLEPLPYARPEQLVAIWPEGFISNADLEFMRTRVRSFSAVSASSPGWTMSLVGAGEPLRVTASKVSANLFDLLGVRPLIGRTFAPGEDAPGRHRVALLSYALWQTKFAGDAAVLGRTVTLEDAPHQVIGVMPADFELLGRDAELWIPLPFDVTSPFYRSTISQAIGRLRENVGLEAAARELRSLVPAWQQQLRYEKDWGQGATAAPLRDRAVGDVERPLAVLVGAVGLIVLLTATNLGTLLLGRHVARRREIAIRGALGASSWRLVRQSATESLVLATLGVAAGTLTAYAALPALVRLLPPEMPRLAAIDIDPAVMALVFGVSVVSVLTFGLVPVASGGLLVGAGAGRTMGVLDSHVLLRQGAQTEPASSRRTLHGLVIGQVALAIVLGIGAALMVRSLLALQSVDPGFDARRVLTLKLQPSGQRYRGLDRTLAYYRQVVNRIKALPGVEAAGAINHLPLSGYNWNATVQFDHRPLPPGVSPPRVGWRMIDGEYFASMGIPLRDGRVFTAHDMKQAPPVAIVNEAFSRHFFGDARAALGRTVRIGSAAFADPQPTMIVGIVGDVRHRALAEEPEPEVYQPVGQAFAIALAVTVRTADIPGRSIGAVREAVWSLDRDVAIADLLPLTTLLRDSLGRPRLVATLLLIFALVGLAILVSGVYGVVAYSVRRREREMGIRLALGAAPRSVSGLVIRQGIAYAVGGLAIGLPVALAATGVMRGLLFGVEPRDPGTVAGLSALVAAVTIAATLVPARRAMRVEPASVLKSE
jgi:putative ABC transport system permease protein